MCIVTQYFTKVLKDKTLTKEEKIEKMMKFFRKEYPKISKKDVKDFCEHKYKEFFTKKKSDTSFYYG